ncbi:hypothetical protein NMY22_g2997 [Coprinellus aureogranulatus]|nr:hypothetical protein NMY22_g2997 [Coprinellus aureogranulatus]
MQQKPECNEHKSLDDNAKIHKGCDITGVGAWACLRHGSFFPSAVVNFKRGERQVDMDWGCDKAVNYGDVNGLHWVLIVYDVNCQFEIHHLERVQQSKGHLKMPNLPTKYAIGTWHVHGHKDECYPRYGLLFVVGSGMQSGEIVETAWAILNKAAGSLRGMTIAHRQEMLDALINDMNKKKIISGSAYVVKKYKQAVTNSRRYDREFAQLHKNQNSLRVEEWKRLEREAQEGRDSDRTAMDIYSSIIEAPPTVAEISLEIQEEDGGKLKGLAGWLELGIEIERTQIRGRLFKLPALPSPKDRVNLRNLEDRVCTKLPRLYETAKTLFRGIDFDDLEFENKKTGVFSQPVPLPSRIKAPLPPSLSRAAAQELRLREAQANDALAGIRKGISQKSQIYKHSVRGEDTKKRKLRGHKNAKAAQREIHRHVKVYESAVGALRALNASAAVMGQFLPIEKKDLEPIPYISEPNARGSSKVHTAWFWRSRRGDAVDSYTDDADRVTWLRDKARRDRWREEVEILRSEMDWSINYFRTKARHWRELGKSYSGPGKEEYAHSRAEFWQHLESAAQAAFEPYLEKGADAVPSDSKEEALETSDDELADDEEESGSEDEESSDNDSRFSSDDGL